MKIHHKILIILLCLLFALHVSAENQTGKVSKVAAVIKIDKQINRLQARLKTLFGKLTLLETQKVLEKRSASLQDSDEDSLPDIYESNTGLCEPDSDQDGIDDGVEIIDGQDPTDSDSDDDGVTDDQESGLSGTWFGEWELVSDNCNLRSRLGVEQGRFSIGINHNPENNLITIGGFTAPTCHEELEGYLNLDSETIYAIRTNDFECPDFGVSEVTSTLIISGLDGGHFNHGSLVREATCGEHNCRLEYAGIGHKISPENFCE